MNQPAPLRIAGRLIGPGQPAFLIAEMSANHHQQFEHAVRLIRLAREAGADAIKLQTYTADTITLRSDQPWFKVQGTIWEGRMLHDLYQEAYTPWEWQPELKRVAEGLGLVLFSTPFDPTSVDFLERMQVPAYKVASFELTDLPLIRRIAATGKPIIMSTGMATAEEIAAAVAAARAAGNRELALLKCTSSYPAPPEESHLRTIPDLQQRFGVPVGLSDHTLGIAVPVAAVALGACIIEKHVTESRAMGGPDSSFSLEPAEFRAMADAVRTAETSLGGVSYGPTEHERASLRYRRSLFAVEDIRRGEPFTAHNVRSIRPSIGLEPRHLEEVLRRRAACDIARGTPLSWDLTSGGG